MLAGLDLGKVNSMKNFLRNEDGYVALMFAIFIPVFLGMGLIIFDISRGNSARTDLQAAADAMALAAARELDRGPDSIQRALQAVEDLELLNTVGLLTLDNPVVELRSGEGLTVTFLSAIPDSDDDPIDAAWIAANAVTDEDAARARFVHVRAQSDDLRSFFPTPATLQRQTVPIAAEAVATRNIAVCDIPPVFVCNPFEEEGENLRERFLAGDLHARMIRLIPSGGNTAFPGNFGFLRVDRANSSVGTRQLNEYLAGRSAGVCFDDETVDTAPGRRAAVRFGYNVRFDLWAGSFRRAQDTYTPAPNVRKGYNYQYAGGSGSVPQGRVCRPDSPDSLAQMVEWGAFPANTSMIAPGGPGGVAGARIAAPGSYWAVGNYLETNYNNTSIPVTPATIGAWAEVSGLRPPGGFTQLVDPLRVSRYEVYRYEIEEHDGDLLEHLRRTGGSDRESGLPICWANRTGNDPEDMNRSRIGDPRLMTAAVVNCNALEGVSGQENDIPVEAWVSIFLTRPMMSPGGGSSGDDDEITQVADCLARNNQQGCTNQLRNAGICGQNESLEACEARLLQEEADRADSEEEAIAEETAGSTIDVEIVDVAESGIDGQLEEILRIESVLIR